MAPNYSAFNKTKHAGQIHHDLVDDDMSLVDPPEEGLKGGLAKKDTTDNDQPMSLVDFLWKHHND